MQKVLGTTRLTQSVENEAQIETWQIAVKTYIIFYFRDVNAPPYNSQA
jgi:hypothetical protein